MSQVDPSIVTDLAKTAETCRLDIIEMIAQAGCGHPGGSLSAIDIITTLFFHEMRLDSQNPQWEGRDRFVLSKGHGVPALYSALAKKGMIPAEELKSFRQVDSRLQGHPDRVRLPLVEASTGSLGQGLSIAQGIALAMKLQQRANRVFCLMGDGEIQEGQIWETVLSAPKFKLNNLVGILDNNNGQIDGHVTEVMNLAPIAEKWQAFGWVVHEVNGHDFSELVSAFQKTRDEKEKPSLIWAKTVKGKGVSFMEDQIKWHGIGPSADEKTKALQEIRTRLESL